MSLPDIGYMQTLERKNKYYTSKDDHFDSEQFIFDTLPPKNQNYYTEY